jgi:DNA-binding protein HU-beta
VNKSELIDTIAGQVGGRSAAATAVDAVIETIERAVTSGERVVITGFGVFEKANRSARMGRNPATGAAVRIKKSSVPKFRPGTEFKAYVNGTKKLTKAVKAVAAAPAKKVVAKKAPVTKTVAKKAPAKKVVAKKVVKKAPARKVVAKKAPAKKVVAKKVVKKAPAKRTVAAKSTVKRVTVAKKAPAKKVVAKKAPAKKAPAKKVVASRAPAKKAMAKKAPAKRVVKRG